MPLPDPKTTADFASGATDTDQAVRHKDVGRVRHYEGLLPGQRPYAWTCPGCGTGHMGYVEDGCATCGAGKDGKVGRPEPAVDPLCKACRGNKTVGVKCKHCGGTGQDPDNADDNCLDCGGSGTLTVDCRRCGGTGFDPKPEAPAIHGIPEAVGMSEDVPLTHRSEYLGQPREPLTGMGKIMADSTLPTLEDDTSPPVRERTRYFILAIRSSGEPLVMVEIAESPRVQQIIAHSQTRPSQKET